MNVIDLDGRTPAQKQGLLSQLIVPRPIAMITTLNADGTLNVAPFSYFMPVSGEPPMLAVTVGATREESDAPKDTWVNIERTGDFVINVTTAELRDHIETVAREYPAGVDEAQIAGWHTVASQRVSAPSLVQSPAHLECVVREVIDRGDASSCFSGVHIVLAEVVCITTEDSIMAEPNRIDPTKVHVIGRMGFPYFIGADQDSVFHQPRVSYAELVAEQATALGSPT